MSGDGLVLDAWMRHRHPGNVRLHAGSGLVGWLGLVDAMAAVPTPVALPGVGASAGAWLVGLATLGWLTLDGVVAGTVGLVSWCALHAPVPPVVGLLVFGASVVVQAYAHVGWHETAPFLADVPRVRRGAYGALQAIFAPFLFGTFVLLDSGWRPALRARLVAAERAALLERRGGPWRNWAGTAHAAPARISVPLTLDELVGVVRSARAAGHTVRVVGSGFSWSAIAPTDDWLVFSERLDRIEVDTTDPTRPAVWAEAGVTNRQLDRALSARGLALPWNVVLENVRIAGIVSSGTHGSGRDTRTLGDLVEALEVVDSTGAVRVLSEATVGVEGMRAVRLGLGLFGVILRVRLRVVPLGHVRQVDRVVPVAEALDRIAELVASHDSVELYWFAFNQDLWLRTFDHTDTPAPRGLGLGFSALNLVQNTFLVLTAPVIQAWARRAMPAFQRFSFRRLTFRTRHLPLPEALHYRKWIETVRCGCVEVGFPTDPSGDAVRVAFEAAETLVARYAERGLYPMNLTLNVRFTGRSDALLSPAFEAAGGTCFIEALCVGRPEGWDAFAADLTAAWLALPGALPHWAKELPDLDRVLGPTRAHLGERLDRFRAALAAIEPGAERAFANPLLRRLFWEEGAAAGHAGRTTAARW